MGHDNIPAIVLKTCASELAAFLAKLFQYSYNTGIYTTMRRIAQVCPVPKKWDRYNPPNYCPINLLLIISKVMEGVINSAIKQHMLSNNLLTDAQFRFARTTELLTSLQSLFNHGQKKQIPQMSTICDSSDTEAVHAQMQPDLDNIQAWADK
eukprot:g45408.t1